MKKAQREQRLKEELKDRKADILIRGQLKMDSKTMHNAFWKRVHIERREAETEKLITAVCFMFFELFYYVLLLFYCLTNIGSVHYELIHRLNTYIFRNLF